MKKSLFIVPAIILVTFLIAIAATTLDDFFLPGSQIGQSGNLESPDKCDNCHGGYDLAVEPAFNWRGSMMAQAARDPLFYAALAIANQDAPDVGDLCLRCHTPDGWLNGRCVPTDGSALNNNDRQGVQCDFCHKLVKPTALGTNPFPDDADYTKSVYGTIAYQADQAYLAKVIPIPGTTANGMYLADNVNAKRGPYTDATGRHQMVYSPFHKEAALCGTCHDVSNPAFIRQSTEDDEYVFIKNLPAGHNDLTAMNFDLRHMFPVERTYSEWLASGYNAADGKSCQDCHMKDVTGKGAKMKDAPVRTDLPLHDFTGGNTFVPLLVKDKYAAEVNAAALDAGIERSRQQLRAAADLIVTKDGDNLSVKIVNKTGHKLPTGYPEGRRMWINVKFFNSTSLISESGAYNLNTAELTTQGTKIYECKPGFSALWADAIDKVAGPSFNFAINNKIWFDNRIPPAGFTNAALIFGQSPVVDNGGIVSTTMYPDGQNFDITTYQVPNGATKVEVRLMYQTTSKEYVEFLRVNNFTNNAGQELYDLWVKHGKSAPEIMNESILNLNGGSTTPIAQMTASFIKATRETNKKQANGYAEVKVVSGSTNVSGATVFAEFSGPSAGKVEAVTDQDGIAVLRSRSVNNPTGTWCFTITNITCEGYEYVIPKPFTRACEGDLKHAIIPESMIAETSLMVYPNPSSGRAWINYTIAEPGQSRISVINSSGQSVAILLDKNLETGEYSEVWDGSGYPNGVYYFRLINNQKVVTRPLILKH
jgi:hypothetical protein